MKDSAANLRVSLDEVLAATGAAPARAPSGALVLEGVFTDSRAPVRGGLFVALPGERFDGADFAPQATEGGAAAVLTGTDRAADVAARCPGAAVLAADSVLRALALLARWHRRRMPARVIAVTGSNGKTTTREMTHAALAEAGPAHANEGNLNNEIGAPLTVLGLRPHHRYAVFEIGMNHEGEIARLTATVEPHIGVVTNVDAVHIEHFGTLENVSRAKAELFHGLALDGTAVANADDAYVRERARMAGRRTLFFGRAADADVRMLRILGHDRRGLRFELGHAGRTHEVQLPVVGLHNAFNACAAFAAATAAGVAPEAVVRGLAKARPPGRRLRLSPIPGADASLLDDCYNANPASAVAALATLSELAPAPHRIAVMGDMRELGPEEERGHREVGRAAAAAELKLLVAFGPASRHVAEAAREAGLPADRILHVEDPAAAAARVRQELGRGDLVLVKASRGTRLERVSDLLVPPAQEGAH